MRRIVGWCAGTAIFAGCSLAVSFDGLAGATLTTDGAPPKDVASDGPSATQSDAPSNTPDGDVDAGSSRFCPQSGAVLCSDFDDVDASLPGPWDYFYAPGAVISIESTRVFSPPHALLVQTNDTSFASSLVKSVGATSGATLSFELYIEAFGGNPSAASIGVGNVEIVLQPGAGNLGILEADKQSDGGYVYASDTGAAIPLNTWVHLDFDADFSDLKSTLSVNGSLTVTHAFKFTSEWAGASSATIGLGVGDSDNTILYFDNATIRTR